MRIGLYAPAWPGGATANGITTACAHLAHGLAACGHAVSIISPEPETTSPDVFGLPPAQKPGLVTRLRLRLGHEHLLVPVFAGQIARAVAAARAANGIEVLLMEETQGLCGLVQSQVDIPVVAVLHGPWALLSPRMGPVERTAALERGRIEREAAAFRMCAGISAPSADILETIVAQYGLDDKPHAVMANPAPPGHPVDYDALDDRQRRTLLYVGRFDHLKGGDVLFGGFSRLVAEGCEAYLTMAGPDRGLETGGQTRSLESLLAELPDEVRTRIDWRGPQTKEKVEALRRQHAAAVVTSRFETFGYTVLESMAAGAATVATDVGGIPEILTDGKDGLLIPAENPEALAAACRRLLDEKGLMETLGATAQLTVTERFAPRKIAQQWIDFLEPVAANWQNQRGGLRRR